MNLAKARQKLELPRLICKAHYFDMCKMDMQKKFKKHVQVHILLKCHHKQVASCVTSIVCCLVNTQRYPN